MPEDDIWGVPGRPLSIDGDGKPNRPLTIEDVIEFRMYVCKKKHLHVPDGNDGVRKCVSDAS